jgi:hypothetical protein
VKALARRLSRLEAVSHAREDALVTPKTLRRMAAVHDAECARIREKLMGEGPHEPAVDRSPVGSEARRILYDKLLRDDAPPATEAVRA